MKASDVIQALQYAAGQGTNYYATNYVITNFESIGGGVYEVTTDSSHNLSVNDFVTLSGLQVPTPIVSHSINDNNIYFNTHNVDHDLNRWKDEYKEVTIFDESGFSYTAQLLTVPNRYEFTVAKSISTLPSNPLFIMQEYNFGYNDVQQVTSVTASNKFQFLYSGWLRPPVYDQTFSSAYVRTHYKIAGAIDLDTAMEDYSKQPKNSIWLFVVLGNCDANKDQRNTNDAFITQGRQADWYSLIISNFSVYAFIPELGNKITDTSGRATRDFIESEVRPFLYRALLGMNFPTYLQEQTQSACSNAGDQYHAYNGATYIHQFDFQQIMTISNADTAIRETTRAFRDLDLELKNQFSETTVYTADVNIDEEKYEP